METHLPAGKFLTSRPI